MPNLYGVASAPGPVTFAGIIGSANLVCPAGAETNIITSGPLAAASQGYFIVQIIGTVWLLLGATPSSGLTINGRIGAGADFASFTIPNQVQVANACLGIPITMFGPSSQSIWQAPGSAVNISVNPTAQSVTALYLASQCYFALLRAPDQ